jgi:hypothetical protein
MESKQAPEERKKKLSLAPRKWTNTIGFSPGNVTNPETKKRPAAAGRFQF